MRGEGLTLLDRPVAGRESPADGLDGDCDSRRRAAKRSKKDSRTRLPGSETLLDPWPPILPPILFLASELMVPLQGDCKDRPAEESRFCEPIDPPIERSGVEGVHLGTGVLVEGRDGENLNVLF